MTAYANGASLQRVDVNRYGDFLRLVFESDQRLQVGELSTETPETLVIPFSPIDVNLVQLEAWKPDLGISRIVFNHNLTVTQARISLTFPVSKVRLTTVAHPNRVVVDILSGQKPDSIRGETTLLQVGQSPLGFTEPTSYGQDQEQLASAAGIGELSSYRWLDLAGARSSQSILLLGVTALSMATLLLTLITILKTRRENVVPVKRRPLRTELEYLEHIADVDSMIRRELSRCDDLGLSRKTQHGRF